MFSLLFLSLAFLNSKSLQTKGFISWGCIIDGVWSRLVSRPRPSLMMIFIIISYLFNYIFWIYLLRFLGFIYYGFLLVPINNTLCFWFW